MTVMDMARRLDQRIRHDKFCIGNIGKREPDVPFLLRFAFLQAQPRRPFAQADQRAALEDFLALDVKLGQAPDALGRFCSAHGLSMPGSVEALAALVEGLDESAEDAVYRASFGRRLDYYTGLVFEIFRKGGTKPVIGGGRYDRLMTLLGAPTELPAVGFAIWVDRMGDEQ